MTRTNSQWVLKQRPDRQVSAADLDLIETPVGDLQDGEVRVRNLYLSLDPANRIWMSDRDQYRSPAKIGELLRGTTLGVIEESRSARLAEGDIVLLDGGWRLYAIASDRQVRKITPAAGVPLTAYLSVLGPTGLTAYFGLLDIGQPKPGEVLVVSAAAGAVGSVAGQIGKIKGCTVIGIAGGPAKCGWVTQELGFDAAIDYKGEDVGAALDRLCPEGVDIDFENVGGAIMDAVFSRLRQDGRMALCGLISGYNQEGVLSGPTDFARILMKRLTVRGFIVSDHLARAEGALADLGRWVAEGRLRWKDHVVEGGLAAAPEALNRLFRGDHDGKLMLRVSSHDGVRAEEQA